MGGHGVRAGLGAASFGRVTTKADVVVAPATETQIVFAADIPPGTKRMTIINIGANPARLKGRAEGGGNRGAPVAANQPWSFDVVEGVVTEVDAFSTLGTTFAFIFEVEA